MAETSDTSAIDEKKESKQSNKKTTTSSNIINFALNVFILFLIILAYFGCSGLILYICKLAQSNILPTEEGCFPYTHTPPIIEEIKTNIFPATSEESKIPLSMKIKFPYNAYNSSNKFITILREYKDKTNSNFIANYFISIMESLLQMNYLSFNYVLNALNGLPEVFLVLFGPILVGIVTTFIFIVNNIYLIYLWFANMGWFFKTNTNEKGEGKPKWEDVTLISPFNYGSAIGLLILFIILFFFSFGFLPLVVFFSIVYCLLSCLSYSSELNNKKTNCMNIVQDVYKYYKDYIFGVFSLFVIINAFKKLGTPSGIFSVITIALIYLGIIHINIFKPVNKELLTPLVSDEQAKKTCEKNSKHAWSRDIFQGGGSFIKQLKKFSKKYSPK